MTPQALISTAKTLATIDTGDEELDGKQFMKLLPKGREEARCVQWLLATGLYETISTEDLEIAIEKNNKYRENRL